MTVHAFADPVFDAQRVFRATMNALARPGLVQPLAADLAPPPPLGAELGALALTLADADTPIWLDAALAGSHEVMDYLRFHTGARLVGDPAEAVFALASAPALCPPLASFASGTAEFPDRSATLLIQTRELSGNGGFTLRGPGIDGIAELHADPLPADFPAQWAENSSLFPCGVDVLLVAPGLIAGLPRTTRLRRKD